jgi:hypothetical protein
MTEITKYRPKKKKKPQRINKTKSWSFEKKNKINKSLANMTKMRREKTQICKIRNRKGEITINTKEIQRIITDCLENLYSNKLENLDKMDKFIKTYDHPKCNQEDINHLNRSITWNKVEAAIESPKKEKSRT